MLRAIFSKQQTSVQPAQIYVESTAQLTSQINNESNRIEEINNQLKNSEENEHLNQPEQNDFEPFVQFDQSEETTHNDFVNDLNEFVRDQKITKEDLAAAFLAAFYGNSNTQTSLKDYIDLVNQLILTKDNQLPNSFNGLISLLNGKKQKLNYEKSWYCGVCQKLIEKLDNRFQRECSTCNSR